MDGATSNPELGSVIVGVDGSKPARQATLWAAAEAARRKRPLHIVYGADTDTRALFFSVESLERVRQAGRELLDSTAAAVTEQFPGLPVNTEFSRSAPVPSLHRSAGLHGTIVVGSRGAGGFSTLMLGSVGLKVAAGAKTPVIVVRGIDNGAESGWCSLPSAMNTTWTPRATPPVRPSFARARCGCCTCGASCSPPGVS